MKIIKSMWTIKSIYYRNPESCLTLNGNAETKNISKTKAIKRMDRFVAEEDFSDRVRDKAYIPGSLL